MQKISFLLTIALFSTMIMSCKNNKKETETSVKIEPFKYQVEQFGDFRVLRYEIPGFEKLDLKNKILLYYLYEAAQSGRDIVYDQNYRYNLTVRKTLEQIIANYEGDKNSEDYKNFILYAKSVFASNGIHFHYSSEKIIPAFSKEYLNILITSSTKGSFPISENQSKEQFISFITPIIFDTTIDNKQVVLDPTKDIIKESATNYYQKSLTYDKVSKYYGKIIDKNDTKPISYGLNSKLMLNEKTGELYEATWKVGGMYSKSIEKVVANLEQALNYTENDTQKKALAKLIEFYKTGDLKTFDEYSILWVNDTNSVVDVVNGFIEVYADPIGKKGAYQSMVSIRDIEASKRTKTISSNAQWFEDNLPIAKEYKKANAVGVNAKAINVVSVAGDNSPSVPIGVNLPNSSWIRSEYGSKSVTISNLSNSYDQVAKTNGASQEFLYSQELIDINIKYGDIAGNIHTDLHEIIGHGSGKMKDGVSDPSSHLKNYYSALEETRAELVGLYFIMDKKLVELGLIPSLEAAKAQYNSFLINGMFRQLVRVKPGAEIEQAHMRARKLIAEWTYDKGKTEKAIEIIKKDNKSYLVINDYAKVRVLFGELLKEIQRIKSEGDYEAGKNLIEKYAVKVDPTIHTEIINRWNSLNIAPYSIFINPVLIPVYENKKIVDVKVEYPEDFLKQMIYYGEKYSFLPVMN